MFLQLTFKSKPILINLGNVEDICSDDQGGALITYSNAEPTSYIRVDQSLEDIAGMISANLKP